MEFLIPEMKVISTLGLVFEYLQWTGWSAAANPAIEKSNSLPYVDRNRDFSYSIRVVIFVV